MVLYFTTIVFDRSLHIFMKIENLFIQWFVAQTDEISDNTDLVIICCTGRLSQHSASNSMHNGNVHIMAYGNGKDVCIIK